MCHLDEPTRARRGDVGSKCVCRGRRGLYGLSAACARIAGTTSSRTLASARLWPRPVRRSSCPALVTEGRRSRRPPHSMEDAGRVLTAQRITCGPSAWGGAAEVSGLRRVTGPGRRPGGRARADQPADTPRRRDRRAPSGGQVSSSRTGRGAVAGCGHLSRKPEVGDNLPDDDGVFDGGHGRQTNYAAARGGGQTCGGDPVAHCLLRRLARLCGFSAGPPADKRRQLGESAAGDFLMFSPLVGRAWPGVTGRQWDRGLEVGVRRPSAPLQTSHA
jgi:hypothetical protein